MEADGEGPGVAPDAASAAGGPGVEAVRAASDDTPSDGWRSPPPAPVRFDTARLPGPALAGSSALEDLFGLTRQRVDQMVGEGMPKHSRGVYDVEACVRWYIRRLQAELARRSPNSAAARGATIDGGNLSLLEAQTRKAAADAVLKELDIRVRRGELVEVAAASALWATAVGKLRARMVASVKAAAVRAVGVKTTAAAHALLLSVVNDALAEAEGVASELERGAD